MVRMFRSKFYIETGFYIILALSLLIMPFSWVLGWFFAVFFHESCHYLVLKLYKIPVFRIKLSTFGAEMLTGEMTARQEIICALAGPLGSLMLLALLQVFPYVSLCALGQSVFNLTPIYPMDGGRVVTGICVAMLGKKKGIQFGKVISFLFSIILVCFCLLITLRYQLGAIPLLFAGLIILRTLKIPCKERKLIVQ